MRRESVDRPQLSPSPQKRTLPFLAALMLIAVVIFAYTVEQRKPWFGVYTGLNHDWLTASTVIFTDNWYREGAWNLKFGLYDLPRSPELSTQLSRSPYLSYPPGAVLPVYSLSRLAGQEPSAGLVMGYNLANHLFIALALSLTAFFFVESLGMGRRLAFTFALIPLLLELWLPAPFYFHQNAYFSDQAVLLPFALAVLLEVLRSRAAGRCLRLLDILQGAIFLYGVFTDWLFVFVALAFYLKRLWAGEISRRGWRAFFIGSLKFAAWPMAGLALFFLYLGVVMWGYWGFAIDYLGNKYLGRSGVGGDDEYEGWDYVSRIMGHIDQGYSFYGRIVIGLMVLFVLAAGVYLLLRRRAKAPASPSAKRIAQLGFLLLAPCLMQIVFFLNHSAVHSFSVLKLSLPLALVPFVLLPVAVAVLLRDHAGLDFRRSASVGLAAALVLSGAYLAVAHGGNNYFASKYDSSWHWQFEAIARHTGANDSVFSPELEITYHPPQLLALSRKRVHRVKNFQEISQTLKAATGDYRVVLIFARKPQEGSYWHKALVAADSSLEDGLFYLFLSPESAARLSDQ